MSENKIKELMFSNGFEESNFQEWSNDSLEQRLNGFEFTQIEANESNLANINSFLSDYAKNKKFFVIDHALDGLAVRVWQFY